MPNKCVWGKAWIGPCGEETSNHNNTYCKEHSYIKCSSCHTNFATHDCDQTMGPLVCGAPLCNGCRHDTGGWNHSKTSFWWSDTPPEKEEDPPAEAGALPFSSLDLLESIEQVLMLRERYRGTVGIVGILEMARKKTIPVLLKEAAIVAFLHHSEMTDEDTYRIRRALTFQEEHGSLLFAKKGEG